MCVGQASGYRLVPRSEYQDLDHALLALRGLGRFHGMAKVLEERGIICKDNYGKFQMMENKKMIKLFTYASIRSTAQAIRDGWGPTW